MVGSRDTVKVSPAAVSVFAEGSDGVTVSSVTFVTPPTVTWAEVLVTGPTLMEVVLSLAVSFVACSRRRAAVDGGGACLREVGQGVLTQFRQLGTVVKWKSRTLIKRECPHIWV